jgi:hypothetical protein
VSERFCAGCGQERKSLRIPFLHLVGEALGELFSLDSRIGRTLPRLFLRPGAATRTYLDGQRASQTSPVKLYLVTSFAFFLVSALGSSQLGLATTGGDARAQPAVELSDDAIDGLRAYGALGALVAARLEQLEREPADVAGRRITRAFVEHVPTAMFFLVPVLAVFLRLTYPRTRVFLAEHLVFSMHAHAVAFVFLLPGAALGRDGLQGAGLAASALHFVLALRRVYGQGWRATLAKSAALGFLYAVALGVSLIVVIVIAVLS